MRFLKRPFKLYRKFRYRKGYGIHSPFAYNLITKVIEEKTPFYAFDEIEKERQKLLEKNGETRRITQKETQGKNYGALLFRLVNFFKCRTVLQIGGSTGIMSLYFSMSAPKTCTCWVLEERGDLLNEIREFTEHRNLNKWRISYGAYEESLSKLKNLLKTADILFLNQFGNPELTKRAFDLSQSFIGENTILIIDGIEANKKMRSLWKEWQNLPDTQVSVNLYALGILFFNKKLQKQHYKNYFNYGKKQNLYWKRRRRIHFFGRRNKGSQNESSN